MKRFTATLFSIILCAIFLSQNFSALESANITKSLRIGSQDARGYPFLLFDGSRTTGISVSLGDKVDIQSKNKIKHLYLIWDTPHSPWDLLTNKDNVESRKTYGQDGFLHEYVLIDEATSSLTLDFRGENQILCDIYAFGEGDTVPSWVQMWQPPQADADLLLLPSRVGDEFLYFGGAIPYYSVLKQKKVQVAYMTNVWSKPNYTHELLSGLYDSGLRAYPVFSDFPETTSADLDSALQVYSDDAFLAYTIELLRRFQPEVVVGQGEFGDGTQLLSSQTLGIAAELSGNALEYPDSAKKYGEFDVPKTYMHAYSDKRVTMDWNIAIPELGGKTALTAAKESFSLYSWRKQRSLEVTGTYDCRSFGLKRSIVGEDIAANDLFENMSALNKLPKPESSESEASSAVEPVKEILPAPEEADEPESPQTQGILANISSTYIMAASAVFCIAIALLLRLKKD